MIKEKVIKETSERITKRIKEIDFILNSNPLSEIIQLRKEVQKKHRRVKKYPDEAFLKFLDEALKKEEKLFDLARKQQNSSSLIDEKVDLAHQLEDLNRELFYLKRGII